MIRQTLIDALKTQLSLIKVVNGYATDIGNNVQSMYKLPVETLPVVNIIEDGSDVPQVLKFADWQHDLPVEVTIAAENTIDYMRLCVNDVLKAIKSDRTIGGFCVDVDPGDIKITKYEEGRSYADASIKLTLQYLTDEWEI